MAFKYLLPLLLFSSCISRSPKFDIIVNHYQVPVLINKPDNPVLSLELIPKLTGDYTVNKVKFSLEGTTDLNDIQSVKLYYSFQKGEPDFENLFGNTHHPLNEFIFNGNLDVSDTVYFWLSVQLNDCADLLNKININCKYLQINRMKIKPDSFSSLEPPDWSQLKGIRQYSRGMKRFTGQDGNSLRIGVALRQHMDDGVHTYRIPGLATTNNGVLLAVYDVRRESSRDLQGDIDIGMSRSTDGGQSWEPMKIILDKGEWGQLSQKFNGVSDANILVDKINNRIFVSALWMHGVLDENGKWIEGLTNESDAWEHQWKRKGSQPGYGVKETSQFLQTVSDDDGKSWSEPLNITRMGKKENWWLWAPAPGQGITLSDSTLVVPTQGRDHTGMPFSAITWSKDRGNSWTTSTPAYFNTTECNAVELSDGSIMLNMRHNSNRGDTTANNGRAVSLTHDLGISWTEHITSRSALIEPTCMACLHKHEYTQKGNKKSILLFSNPHSPVMRHRMTIKVSFDEGMTWPEEHWLLLDELRGRGYSCITSVDEDHIGILYEGSQADLIFQKISLSDILSAN